MDTLGRTLGDRYALLSLLATGGMGQVWRAQDTVLNRDVAVKVLRSDNATMEPFFSLLQKNVLNRRRWQTRAELRLAIVSWIEKTYHRRRRQDASDA